MSARGDVTKLPKWAQQRIACLERDVEWWKAKALDGPENADTFTSDGRLSEDKPLGEGTRVKFVLDAGQWDGYITARIEDRPGRRFLYVNAGRALRVRPHSSNVIEVEVEDR